MPVATAAKVQALSVDFRSQAALAEILGVSRSRVTRWLRRRRDRPDERREGRPARTRLVEPAARLRQAARSWLWGVNPQLGDRRPIDLVRAGRAELMRAIRAERADSFA